MKHKKTDPACTQYKTPVTWMDAIFVERGRGKACLPCASDRWLEAMLTLDAPSAALAPAPEQVRWPARRWTIWQCRDWCCEQRDHGTKWWNVGPNPGNYHSVPSWSAALAVVRSGRLPWDAA